MDSFVVNVGRDGRDVSIRVAVRLLLIADEMLLLLSAFHTAANLSWGKRLTLTLVMTPADCTPTTVS